MLKLLITSTLAILVQFTLVAQIFGPNNPSFQNIPGAGNNWSGANAIFNSDNTYVSSTASGLTKDLISAGYGFNLTIVDQIVGIELDVERRAEFGADVAILNNWKDGQLSQIPNFTLSNGANRMMIVFVGTENGNEPLVNNVTFAGQSMTRLSGYTLNTSFWGAMECWYMMESQLSSIPAGNHLVQVTYAPMVLDQFFDIVSGVVLQNVDQISPFNSISTNGYNGGNSSCNFSNPIVSGIGGAYLTAIFCGNPPNGGASNGSTNNWSINSGFTEGTDVYRANTTVAPTTGGCMQTAFKLGTLGGTENPTFTFAGKPNRRLLYGFGLRKATTVDHIVRLRKSTGPVGNNYANVANQWSLTDTYVTYGSPADMWGTTWSNVDVNSPLFGSLIEANVLNGIAHIDHIRIKIYTVNILPVELIDFQSQRISERSVNCEWYTASEHNTSHFEVQRSLDGINFEKIAVEDAAGSSQSVLDYSFVDDSAPQDELYYRLKLVDINGEFTYSDIRAVSEVKTGLTVYPNPTNDWINVLSSEKNGTITITSSTGQIIDQAEGSSFSSNYKYNLSSEPDGVYFIIVNSEKGQEIKRLVKTTK